MLDDRVVVHAAQSKACLSAMSIGTPKPSQATICPMSIGKRVSDLRKAAGLSPAELSRRVGIRQPSLWELENGITKMPKGSTLMKLSQVLGVSPDWLQTGKGQPFRIALSGDAEGELVSIYRTLPESAQHALLAAARGIAEANAPSAAHPFRTKKPR